MNILIVLFRKITHVVYRIIVTLISLFRLLFNRSYYDSDSYFPEYKFNKKSSFRIFCEQIINVLIYGWPNDFYFLYGLDIKGFHKNEDFVDNYLFMDRRNKMDFRIMSFPPISILRDKALFGTIAEAYGINTPHNIGIIHNGVIFLFEKRVKLDLRDAVNNQQINEGWYFVKKIDGECADGVYRVFVHNGKLYHHDVLVDYQTFFISRERYLLQEAISNQHPAISDIHPKAINTIRLVTVHDFKRDEIEVFSCVLRVGKGENSVDNWAAGGLSIGVDTEKGKLRKYGFYKPGFGAKATEHPDTHIVFEGYKIPFLDEAIKEAKEFHSHLYGIHSIGWDIAITEDGPCFIEGNDNWEISLMQISNYGLRKDFDRLFY